MYRSKNAPDVPVCVSEAACVPFDTYTPVYIGRTDLRVSVHPSPARWAYPFVKMQVHPSPTLLVHQFVCRSPCMYTLNQHDVCTDLLVSQCTFLSSTSEAYRFVYLTNCGESNPFTAYTSGVPVCLSVWLRHVHRMSESSQINPTAISHFSASSTAWKHSNVYYWSFVGYCSRYLLKDITGCVTCSPVRENEVMIKGHYCVLLYIDTLTSPREVNSGDGQYGVMISQATHGLKAK